MPTYVTKFPSDENGNDILPHQENYSVPPPPSFDEYYNECNQASSSNTAISRNFNLYEPPQVNDEDKQVNNKN